MCRMLGMVCNDEDLLACAVAEARESLRLRKDEPHDGIGIGYYQDDEPLLKKRPSESSQEIDYGQLVEGITSNVLLVHVRHATVGAWKEANTHPFRFRRWLFAHLGTLPALEAQRDEITASLPPFLARNLRGETDSELAFHLFLGTLYREGALNDPNLPAESLGKALRDCLASIDQRHEGDRHPPLLSLLVTNGRVMGAVCRGVPMHYSHREGIPECPRHTLDEAQTQVHRRFKGIFLGAAMTDPGHQWREVSSGSLLTVSGSLELAVSTL